MSYWAAARAQPQREAAAQHFLQLAGFTVYLPRLRQHRVNHGRKVEVRPPLFPGYLFVRVGNTGWSRVENTIGILQLLRTGDKPAIIADHVIEEIQSREHNGVVKLPERPRWQAGDRVRIGNGTFLGQIGLFDGMGARERVFVLLNLFGRQTRAELSIADLHDPG